MRRQPTVKSKAMDSHKNVKLRAGIIQPKVPDVGMTLWKEHTCLDSHLMPYNNKFHIVEEEISKNYTIKD